MATLPRSPFSAHSLLSLSAVAMILALLIAHVNANRQWSDLVTDDRSVNIGIEHSAPLEVSLTFSLARSPGIAEIAHTGTETPSVSIPAVWSLREVRGAALASVKRDPPSFGLIRYTLPPHATLSFSVPENPLHVFVHNAATHILSIRSTLVDLDSGHVERDFVLVKEKKMQLW